MSKAPRAGQVKTRLVPPLTHEEAARLNACFLHDTAAAIASIQDKRARGIAVYTPIGAEIDYVDILPRQFELLPQRGEDFGERLLNALIDLFKVGFSSVCLIDSDSPTVSGEVYSRAIELLSTHENPVVLGPSDDGGYYLIGLKKPHARLFQEIDWSTERVLEQTKFRAAELGLKTELLPVFYDVDDGATLKRLYRDLLGEANLAAAPHTRKFLTDVIGDRQL